MTKKIILILGATALLFSGLAASTTADKEKAAVAAAQSWLKLVDDGRYGDSWQEAASLFRNSITKEQWMSQIQIVRQPLGKNLSRTLKNSNYTTTAPGAPDGEYVIIQFDTSFENKKAAIETVTPMMDKDGKWRVSGYYIR